MVLGYPFPETKSTNTTEVPRGPGFPITAGRDAGFWDDAGGRGGESGFLQRGIRVHGFLASLTVPSFCVLAPIVA